LLLLTIESLASIFDMKHCLVDLYKKLPLGFSYVYIIKFKYQFKIKVLYLFLLIVYIITCSLSWRVLICRWAKLVLLSPSSVRNIFFLQCVQKRWSVVAANWRFLFYMFTISDATYNKLCDKYHIKLRLIFICYSFIDY
jgi:membrane-associated HD superfamily phosphohydrolase